MEGGLRGFVCLGGAPGVGKSVLAQQIALMAPEYEIPVLYVDLEHSWTFLVLRMLASYKGKTIEDVKSMLKKEGSGVGNGETGTLNLPPYLHMLTAWSGPVLPEDIIFNIRTLADKGKPILVIIDSLQKLPIVPGMQYRESMNTWLRELEAIKNRYGTTILVVSELSRGEGGKGYATPGLHSLKESGDIEYTAEQILLISPTNEEGWFRIFLAKNKYGPKGEVSGALYSHENIKVWRWKEVVVERSMAISTPGDRVERKRRGKQ